MLIIRQIIQMLHSGLSKRSISEQLGISRNTVKKYIFYVKLTGLSNEEILSLDDNIVSELLTDEPEDEWSTDVHSGTGAMHLLHRIL